MTLASARLKASVQFPPLRGMYQRGGTCKGCDTSSASNRHIWSDPSVGDTGKSDAPLDIWSKDECASVHLLMGTYLFR